MGRSPCCKDVDVKKGPWTPEEDKKLRDYIEKNNGAHGSWRRLPELAGLNRCGKSCRLRWTNYLRPDIKRGRFSQEEEQLIVRLHSVLGNKWSSIAAHLPGRTDNEIKNYWNTHVRRKLLRSGIDPVTHQARTDINLLGNLPNLLSAGGGGFAGHLADHAVIKLLADAADLLRLQNLVQVLSRSTTPNAELMGLLGLPCPAIPTATKECQINGMPAAFWSDLPLNACTPPDAAPEGRKCNSDENTGAEISKGSSSSTSFASFVLAATSAAPSLASASPEGADDSAHVTEPINSGNPSKDSPTSAAFVDWDQDLCLHDLADSDLGWKDIEDQMTWFDGH